MGFKLMAGAVASCALIGVAVGVGIIYGSLLISIGRILLKYSNRYYIIIAVNNLILHITVVSLELKVLWCG